MGDINIIVHNQLKEYAQTYFDAILTLNKGHIKDGNYTAKELADNNYKILGNSYRYPKDPQFAEEITITAGNFTCSFIFAHVFDILYKWEKMMRAGKAAAVFAVGSVEYKTAKLLTNDKDVYGNFRYKRMKLQRVAGNWWTPATKRAKTFPLYYELNGIMFAPGVNCYCEEDMRQRAERLTEEQVIKALKGAINRNRDTLNEGAKCFFDYCAQVAQLAGVALDASDEQRNQLEEQRKAEDAPTNSDANTADLSDCEPSDSKIFNATDKVAEIANKSANLVYIGVNNIHNRQSSSTTSYFIDVGKVPTHSTDIIRSCRCVSIGSVQPTSAIVGKAPPGSGYYIKLTHWHRYNSYICRHRHNRNYYGTQTNRLESTGMGMAQWRGP